MKHKSLLTVATALTVLGAPAAAQQRVAGSGPRITLPSHSNHFSWERGRGFKRGHGGVVWIVERPFDHAQDERVIVREVVREVPAAVPAPPPPPRKPYVIGASYASLPGGCMKMIEGGASYYWCSGEEWYRLVGKQYRAVARP